MASRFGSWLHLGAGPPRLAISPPYSGTSRMVDKPVMVSFLLSSKTSSVRDLNTSGESAYTHVLNCEFTYEKSRQLQRNMSATSAAYKQVTVPKLMLFCWKRCLQYLQLLVLHEESIRMYAPWSHDNRHIIANIHGFLGQAVILSANHIPQIEVQTGKGAVQL